MKNRMTSIFAAGLMVCLIVGCGEYNKKTETKEEKPTTESSSVEAPVTTQVVAMEADICGACGCCAGCDECCKGEKCDGCGYQKGAALCCVEGAPAPDESVAYCKICGFAKGSEKCCADSNVACTKCGLAKGSPICCKVNKEKLHTHDGQDHAEN